MGFIWKTLLFSRISLSIAHEMAVTSGLEMVMSWWNGRGLEPFAITLVLKFTTVGSTRNLGFMPTPLTVLMSPYTSPIPASLSGSWKFLPSSTSAGVYLRLSFKGDLPALMLIYTYLFCSSLSSSSSSSLSSSLRGSLMSSGLTSSKSL